LQDPVIFRAGYEKKAAWGPKYAITKAMRDMLKEENNCLYSPSADFKLHALITQQSNALHTKKRILRNKPSMPHMSESNDM